jgi:hypothetical protein
MPRISAEAKSGAAFRAGGVRRPAPKRMSAAAKIIWREILADRPVDWFRPGSFELLEQFCEVVVQQRKKQAELRQAISEDYPTILKATKDLAAMTVALATKLRITVVSDIHPRSGKIGEKGDADPVPDRLLGGSAIWGGDTRPQ